VRVVQVEVPNFGWWGVVGAPATTGCVTGQLTANGTPATNVWVHASGESWLGAATAVTDGTGSFCLDVHASSRVALSAGLMPSTPGGPANFVAPGPSGPTISAGGTCATRADGGECTTLGTIAMPPLGGSCVTGRLVGDAGPITTVQNVELTIQGVAYAASAGVQPTAYLGQVTPGATGTFCGPAPLNSTFRLQGPAPSTCTSAGITVPNTQGAAACGASGCLDAGDIAYTCN
jgi:hypothetical protein